ncbi:aminopeptidase N-like [Ischnura elegans]|uniref:aminopeptidase N-like n=1 Tax=Ischnura elegans TaxID=197161 RepID=UPI001ED8BBCB|nr:aminopeptidase N-like [Ischnura elegans]
MNFKAIVIFGVLLQAAVVFGRYERRKSLVTAERREKNTDPNYFRLPNSIIPISYDLKIIPVMQEGNYSFTGVVSIILSVLNSTKSITLHTKGLNVTEHSLYDTKYPKLNISMVNATNYKDRDFHVLYLLKNLTVGGRYNLTMKFKGMLQEDLDGFYICSYQNEKGGTEKMAVTQFESISARKAFPCFDEPRFKATFKVSIARPKNMTTLSNMPNMPNMTTSTTDKDLPKDYVLDVYQVTPNMSTYLVAFSVSNFTPNPKNISNPFRVWSRKNAISQTDYSVEVGPKILETMKNITNITYMLPKMDLLAVPDFAAGAMENWGLVTFRETDLLFQNETSTNFDKQNVITVIAHELSHQWFGDLVTTEWWSNLWLNEGFAEYWMYVVTDLMQKDWRLMEQFVSDNMLTPFISDAMEYTQPIVHPVIDPNIGDYSSSDITYGKGASVIRMMECALSREVFFQGLRKYLTERQYNWANQSMLFDAVQAVSSGSSALPPYATVGDVWSSWTTQSGYPVVTVTRAYKANATVISQNRFVLEEFDYDKNERWWIPLTYTTEKSANFSITRPKAWLSPSTAHAIITDMPGDAEWIIFNIQSTGYYRVNYDDKNWKLITNFLKGKNFTLIHPVNRGKLLDDALSLARGGYINYTSALTLSQYMSQETDFIPWYSAYNLFDFLDMLLAGTESYPHFQKYMESLMTANYKKLKFNESSADDHVNLMSRSMMLPRACKYNVDDCVMEAYTQFSHWNTTKINKIPANLRDAVYCYGVVSGGKEAFNFLWAAYDNTTVAAERVRIMKALACSGDKDLLNGYLEETVKENSKIRLQDRVTVFKDVYSRARGFPVALNFVTKRFSDIKRTCGANNAMKILVGLSSRVVKSEDANTMSIFFGNNLQQIDQSTISKSKKNIESNLKWVTTYGQTVEDWLKEKYHVSASTTHQASVIVIALLSILIHQFY